MSGASIARTLLDGALGLGATAAFSIEKISSSYAIGFSLAEMVVNVLFGALSPAPVRPPMGVTSTEMKGDLQVLRRELDDDMFQLFETDKLADMQEVEDRFQQAWNETLYITDTQMGDPNVDTVLRKAWSLNQSALTDEILKKSVIMVVCNWIEDWDARAYQTLDLYMLAAGLYLNICKLNLMWEYDKVQKQCEKNNAPYLAAITQYYQVDLPAYQAALKVYDTAVARASAAATAYQGRAGIPQRRGGPPITGPFSPQLPPVPTKPVAPHLPKLPPQSWHDLTTSKFCDAIAVQSRRFVAYADPLVTALEAKFARLQQDTAKGTNGLTALSLGASMYAVANPPYGATGRAVSKDLADRQVELEKAVVVSGLLSDIDPALRFFDSEKIKKLRATVDSWKATSKNYPLLNHAPNTH